MRVPASRDAMVPGAVRVHGVWEHGSNRKETTKAKSDERNGVQERKEKKRKEKKRKKEEEEVEEEKERGRDGG